MTFCFCYKSTQDTGLNSATFTQPIFANATLQSQECTFVPFFTLCCFSCLVEIFSHLQAILRPVCELGLLPLGVNRRMARSFASICSCRRYVDKYTQKRKELRWNCKGNGEIICTNLLRRKLARIRTFMYYCTIVEIYQLGIFSHNKAYQWFYQTW